MVVRRGERGGSSKCLPVLTANLVRDAGLLAHFGAEASDLFDNELLHALNGVFLLKAEVKYL